MNRVVQITLVIAIVVGGFSVIRQRQMLSDLRKERNRLTAKIGDLSISDPEKFSVIRLATEENTEFLWNVYYPEKVAIRERVELAIGGSTGSGGSANAEAQTRLHRIHFDLNADRVTAHRLGSNSSGMMTFNNDQISNFVREHWSELSFEVLANDKQVDVSEDDVLPLLQIRIPESLWPQVKDDVDERLWKRLKNKPLFRYVVGNSPAVTSWMKAN